MKVYNGYKVGDKVRCITPEPRYSTGESHAGGSGWVEDKIFTVGKITDVKRMWGDNEKMLYILWPDGQESGSGIYHCWCEPVINLPEHLFKL